ncbi:hypothetical protein C2R22_14700 [Salinigranum rubrum]|uniref:PglZ domain-containing protein n=1 Tax=Salinigranum rubrum TaxID=755307 RepID=A0A2I8VLF2_9EURY|nr:hypothetical protein [Salinigranum rubrum]AUV82738.1 hypothetical protein C2R22_14700 [Salinigranum rubrum]
MPDLNVILNVIRREWNDPTWWRRVTVPFVLRQLLVRPYFRYVYDDGEGVDIAAEDWDNLLILDACRYDMFSELNTVSGRLEERRSRGSNTAEFLRRNFAGETFGDIVYVTANPQVDIRLDDPFHATVSVWETAWDEDLDTVRPEAVVDAARGTQERYPNKRLVVHFVQPHYPFIEAASENRIGAQAGMQLSRRMANDETAIADHDHVWDRLKKGEVTLDAVREAYWDNLAVTLPHVERLLDDLVGRTVVTSDHGNLLGERPSPCPLPVRLYGHPGGVYADALVRVPWLVVDGNGRKKVTTGRTTATDGTVSSDADSRLRALGYG